MTNPAVPTPVDPGRPLRLLAAILGLIAAALVVTGSFLPQTSFEQVVDGKTDSKQSISAWTRSFEVEPGTEAKKFYERTHVARYGIPLTAGAAVLLAGAGLAFTGRRRAAGARTALLAGGAGVAGAVWMLAMDVSATLSYESDEGSIRSHYTTGLGFWLLLGAGVAAVAVLVLAALTRVAPSGGSLPGQYPPGPGSGAYPGQHAPGPGSAAYPGYSPGSGSMAYPGHSPEPGSMAYPGQHAPGPGSAAYPGQHYPGGSSAQSYPGPGGPTSQPFPAHSGQGASQPYPGGPGAQQPGGDPAQPYPGQAGSSPQPFPAQPYPDQSGPGSQPFPAQPYPGQATQQPGGHPAPHHPTDPGQPYSGPPAQSFPPPGNPTEPNYQLPPLNPPQT